MWVSSLSRAMRWAAWFHRQSREPTVEDSLGSSSVDAQGEPRPGKVMLLTVSFAT